MKKLLYSFFAFLVLFCTEAVAQSSCAPADLPTASRIAPTAYPYTNPVTGITVSYRLIGSGIYPVAYTSSCGGTSYTTPANKGFVIGNTSGTDTIVLTFSRKVTNFSFILNVSNTTEIVTVTAASGAVSLSNYCTAGYALMPSTTNRLETVGTGSDFGTTVTANNPDGSYVYYITHNYLSGCLFELLDCTVGFKGPANVVDGIQLWLDGSNVNNNPGTNPADNTKIAVWKDISGNGNDAKVFAGQDTARMNTAQINGKDVMQFTGTSGFDGSVYEVPNVDIRATAMPKSTIFTVYRPAAPTGLIQGIWGNDNGDWDRFFMPSFGAADGVVSVGPPTNNVAVATAGQAGTTKLLTAVYHSGVTDSSIVYFNAMPVSRVTDNTDLTDAEPTLRIGWDGDNNPFTGDIAEMVVYNRKLTECEIKAVNRYFGYKYGVSFTSATVTPSTQQYVCPGDSVTLKAGGGSSFQWLRNGSIIASATDSVYGAKTSGNYSVIATKEGCSDTSVATPVTLVPPTIYVDSSIAVSGTGGTWGTAKKTLTEALTLAHTVSCPVQIWIKKGTYFPAVTSRDSSFIIQRNNLKIYGGFAGTESTIGARISGANTTILSGDVGVKGDISDNSYHVIRGIVYPVTSIDTSTVLDGLTVSHGNANGTSSSGVFSTYVIYNTWGGGMYFFCNGAGYSSSPKINNCIFSDNKASAGGGGIAFDGYSGNLSASITNTIFADNTAASGAGTINSFSTINYDNCIFRNNTASSFGGALFQEYNTVTINNSIFDQNSAPVGGAFRSLNGDPTTIIRKSVFYKNTASQNDGGALSLVSGNGKDTIINCVFVLNKASGAGGNGGGAIVQENATSSYIVNNTFYGDSASGNAGAIYFKSGGSNRYLYNNIFYKNYNGTAAVDVAYAAGTTATAESNNSNSTVDPLFVNETDPDGADNKWSTADDGLHMVPCSPLINAGINSAVTESTDLTGANRIQFIKVDAGAYEHNFDSSGKPDITIAANPGNKICAGDTAYFTATLFAAGTSPLYQWYKNGVAVSTSATYGSTAFANNDSVWVVLTNTDCALKDTSNKIVFLVTPPIMYVDGSVAVSGTGLSWLSPYKTVREALNLANYGSTSCPVSIWVKKGTYYPTADGNRDSSFRIARNNIKLYGGFAGGETLLSARSVTANPTILSGDIGVANDSTDNSCHVITILAKSTMQIDTNTVVDGFTITNGNAQAGGSFTYNGITYNRQDGGGMHIWGVGSGNKCTPVIANCTFTRNAANFGGGIYSAGYNTGSNCSPVLRNTTFSFNKANNSGGGLFSNAQNGGLNSPSIDNCTFSNNTAGSGGGLYNQAAGGGTSAARVSNSTFNNNKSLNDGGGFYNSYGKPVITNCGFSQNDAAYSGGAYFQQGGKGTLNNNIFDKNTAQIAGGIRTNSGDPSITITRNVFYRNTSSINDAGAASLVCANGNDTVVNNLFVQNKAFGTGPNGGGAMVQEGGTSSYIVNNTFYADSSAGSGGAVHFKDGGTNRFLYNNIFYKSYNGSSAVDYNTASGATLTASNNLFSSINPRFVKESNPLGADGIWLTNDDGLDLLPCSPAVNTGRTAPPADIRNRTRIGLPDIGAYEEQGRVLPSAPVTTATFSYCQNATATTLSATPRSASDTIKWYNSVPALLPGAPTPSTSVTGTFTWYVSQTDSMGCESAKATITVTIKPTPAAPVATSPVVYCKGVTPVALTATLAAGSDTLKWYDSSMVALPGAPTPSTDTVGTHTWYVSQKTSLNCEGPLKTIIVKVNPTPALPTTKTPITYCQNETAVALTATKASSSDTLKWYNSVPTLLSGAPTPSTATAGTFTFYVSQKNNFSCEGAKKTIKVVVNPTPVAPPSTSPVIYCQEDVPVALTATKASSSDTLMWYDASYTLLGGAPVPSTVSADTAIYYVSAKTSLNCEGPKTRIKVVVNPRPLPPVVVTPIDICVGVPPAALTATGTDLKWYTAATGGTSSATLKPAVGSVGTTIYYVTQTNTFGCQSLRESLKVNVRPSPVVTVAPVGMPAFVFCVGDSVTIKANSATAISYQWQINTTPIPGSVNDTLHIDTTSTYSVIVKNMYGCADTESVFVMKNPLPKPRLSPVDVTICKGVSIILYGSPASTGYKYEWFKDGLPMSVDARMDRITVDTTGYYMVRITDIYTCIVNTNGSSISQYPEMIKPVVVMSGSILKVATTYASYQWYRNGNPIAGATSKTYTMTFDGDYYVVVYDVNGCQGTSEVVTSKGLGINQAQAQGSIRVYPNPTQGKVTIDAGAKVNVIVTDITGRELLRKQQTTEVDLEQFADGIYMLRIFDKEGQLLQNVRINKQTK